MGRAEADDDAATLRLPRILCLHGGGTNAAIFRIQCRSVAEALRREFRLVYAEAPFPSEAGPDVAGVFADCGPFRRWLRFGPAHPEVAAAVAVARLDRSVADAMDADDDEAGASGPWVALLGFSQGAKVAASLLYRQQSREADGGDGGDGGPSPLPLPLPRFRFGVLIAGRGPLVSLEPGRPANASLPDASDSSAVQEREPRGRHVLSVPTIHMHGLKDPGLELHRRLYDEYCDPASRSLVVWDGGHRLPIKTADVAPLVAEIRRAAKETAVPRP